MASTKRKAPKISWFDTEEGRESYHKARAEAQRKANETGFDYGLEGNELFRSHHVFSLPGKQYRQGHELRCEVVSCEHFDKIQPGHGPGGYTAPRR